MHGRLKVKTTAEQQAEKQKEREKKLLLYTGGCQKASEKRRLQEFDSEALAITGQLLQGNPDFYTHWNFRKEILCAIISQNIDNNGDTQELLEGELYLTEMCLRKNSKSYGAWNHRTWALKLMPSPNWKKELTWCGKLLKLDDRNFHGWNYRRIVCRMSQENPEAELAFTLAQIEANFSNYSAWHYRSSLLPQVHPSKNDFGPLIDQETLLKEYELVQNATFTDPADQSAWFYHRWLLGRAEIELGILCCFLDKSGCKIVVVLTKPIKKNDTEKLSVVLNAEKCNCIWETNEYPTFASTVWFCDFTPWSSKSELGIIVTLDTSLGVYSLKCQKGHDDLIWKENFVRSLCSLELGSTTSEILQHELESCQQLLDLEPDNKWTLLTCVMLLRALNSQAHEEVILNYLDQLVAIDSFRKNYYKDLRSKCLIENKLKVFLSSSERSFKLPGKELTLFCYSDHLIFLKSLDLSNNQIHSLHSLRNLLALEDLNLDHNKVEDCSGLEGLQNLHSLSLNHNSIQNVDNLCALKTCQNLQHLKLQLNPFSETSNFKDQIRELLPFLHNLN